jgi:flagellar hook-length control protein FliK
MTPAPVSTTTTLGGGPAAVGPAESPAPASAAETDEYVDDPAVSPFERILSKGHGAPPPGRTARPVDEPTGAASRPGHGPVPGVPAPPSDMSPDARSGDTTSVDVDALVALDLGVTTNAEGGGGANVTAGIAGADVTRDAQDAHAHGPDGTSNPDGTREADGPGGEGASVDAASHDTARTSTTGDGAGRTSAVSVTSVATTLDNGRPLSLPASAPGFGAAPGPPGSRGAVPAAENPAGVAAPRATGPRATGPGTAAPAATSGIAPSAAADAVESEHGGDGTAATGDTGATYSADVSLDTAGLAGSISGALSRGGGSYNVVLNLHPPELGQVQATLSLRGDQLQVDLAPEHAAAHDALESALPALREHLAQGGVEVDVTLGDPAAAHHGASAGEGSEQGSDRAGGGEDDEPDASLPPATPTATARPRPGRADRLHLVL